jgi:hypothetical protein
MDDVTIERPGRERPLYIPQGLLLRNLPDEVLVHILQALPVKDILSFGAVRAKGPINNKLNTDSVNRLLDGQGH